MRKNSPMVIAGILIAFIAGCTTTSNNAPKNTEMKVDSVAGYSGRDRVIVSEDNALIHSDRDAVREYTQTVDTINNSRQAVEADLTDLVLCRKKKAEIKGIAVKEGPMTVPCMEKVVVDRDRSGEDLMQVNGKLVLRKKDDFKGRLEESRTCLDQMNSIRDKARQDYMLEGCRAVMQ